MEFIARALRPSQESFFLFGPRGTGKSTWLKQQYPDAFVLNLLNPATYREYSAKPERLKEAVYAAATKCIVIDEVQKIPELLSVVHELIEEHSGFQFILTGSSARKLKQTGVNLLAGRAVIRHMHPFIASELKSSFNLSQALDYGLVPVILNSENPADKLDAYIGLYLKEEVQAEGLVRHVGDFARFLETVSFSHAEQLNVSNIARESGISRRIVEGYLSILEDLLLSFTLPVFTRRAKREMVSHVKFYLFDTGVFRFLRMRGPIEISLALTGAAVEGLVAQHLRAWIHYYAPTCSLSYWRTRAGNEVDFILYGPNCFYAIEVKSSEHVHPKDLSGLKAFGEDYPESQLILLYCGKEKLLKGNILCIPIESFLQEGQALLTSSLKV